MSKNRSTRNKRNQQLTNIHRTKHDYLGLNALFVSSAVSKFLTTQNEQVTHIKIHVLLVSIYLQYNSIVITKVTIYNLLNTLGLSSSPSYIYNTFNELVRSDYYNPLGNLGKPGEFKRHEYITTIKFRSLMAYVDQHFNDMAEQIEKNKYKKKKFSIELKDSKTIR